MTFVVNFLFTPLLTHPQEPFQIFPLLNTNTLVLRARALGAPLKHIWRTCGTLYSVHSPSFDNGTMYIKDSKGFSRLHNGSDEE